MANLFPGLLAIVRGRPRGLETIWRLILIRLRVDLYFCVIFRCVRTLISRDSGNPP